MRRALMWLNLYGHEAVRHKLKNGLKTQKMHFCLFKNFCFLTSNKNSRSLMSYKNFLFLTLTYHYLGVELRIIKILNRKII